MPPNDSSKLSSDDHSDTSTEQPDNADGPKSKRPSLDSHFSPDQLKYLQETRETYRYSPHKLRKELAQATYTKFIKDMEAGGRPCSKEDKAAVNENVRTWYAQRARSRKDEIRWGIQWVPRQVFYKENIGLVLGRQAELYAEAVGVHASDVDIEPAEIDAAGDQESETPEVDSTDPKKPPKPFNFFQKALGMEWGALDDDEKQKYQEMAIEWRERGPNEDEKRRQFSRDIYHQMGVRMVSLVSYHDTTGRLCVSTMDFNNKIDGGKTFKSGAKGWWEKHDPEGQYGMFVAKLARNEETFGKELGEVVLKVNEYGEPVLPDPKVIPPRLTPNKYYVKLIRAFVLGCYACARGVKSTSSLAHPPWTALSLHLRQFIDKEYFPDHLGQLNEPNKIRVSRAKEILLYWYGRQKDGLIPLQFHNYLVADGQYAPREPRELCQNSGGGSTGESESDRDALPRRHRGRKPKVKIDLSDSEDSESDLPRERKKDTGGKVKNSGIQGRKGSKVTKKGKGRGKGGKMVDSEVDEGSEGVVAGGADNDNVDDFHASTPPKVVSGSRSQRTQGTGGLVEAASNLMLQSPPHRPTEAPAQTQATPMDAPTPDTYRPTPIPAHPQSTPNTHHPTLIPTQTQSTPMGVPTPDTYPQSTPDTHRLTLIPAQTQSTPMGVPTETPADPYPTPMSPAMQTLADPNPTHTAMVALLQPPHPTQSPAIPAHPEATTNAGEDLPSPHPTWTTDNAHPTHPTPTHIAPPPANVESTVGLFQELVDREVARVLAATRAAGIAAIPTSLPPAVEPTTDSPAGSGPSGKAPAAKPRPRPKPTKTGSSSKQTDVEGEPGTSGEQGGRRLNAEERELLRVAEAVGRTGREIAYKFRQEQGIPTGFQNL
ncbi:hypothetical protein D9611_012900 [Ephemerocybe angulata]|uniref:HMG box domain-containing protein n=1 Tax=Ephemerocybe angulata TaxID=980116 RepID=A0A8H5C600_9AGAR|nr:hypothetical protein D9611_012900 [Tulosesus angulatus]